jgi:hypothetical protein
LEIFAAQQYKVTVLMLDIWSLRGRLDGLGVHEYGVGVTAEVNSILINIGQGDDLEKI